MPRSAALLRLLGTLALLLACAAHDAAYRIHHRIHLPLLSAAAPPFTPRGELRVHAFPATSREQLGVQAPGAGLSGSVSSEEGLQLPPLQDIDEIDAVDWEDVVRRGWYQVALEVEGLAEGDWPFASGRLCHLLRLDRSVPRETLTLHPTSPPTLSYTLHNPSPTPGCPLALLRSLSSSADLRSLLSDLPPLAAWNTTVRVRPPGQPDAPHLAPPKALEIDPKTGEEKPPPHPMAEKSFVQKNWMYIVGGFLLLSLLAGGGEDPRAQGPAKGGAGGKK